MSRRLAAATLAAGFLLGLLSAPALADRSQESVFQDDAYLIFHSTAVVNQTLSRLHSLGVQRLRVNVKWSAIAPDPTSLRRPPGFQAANPTQYPAAGWFPYDRLVDLARLHGIGVEFNITAPGPLWAMSPGAPTLVAADHWAPSPVEFNQFVAAVGRRYSGSFGGIPRVHVWSIWNEPNQPGWLAPQSRSAGGRQVPVSPLLYREYVQAAYTALYLTGHSRDTFLIGELAPQGSHTPGSYNSMRPMPFLRALYCVDGAYRPLRGGVAAALGCPTGGSRAAFVKANLGLFNASGFAHHPYFLFHPPGVGSADQNAVPLADLGRLERGLDRAFAAYRVHRRLPIYITEYGYQTNPPDPYQVVTPAQQAAYLNQADYIAWRDPRVRSVAQFLLYDSAPNPSYAPSDPRYWATFQTGLLFASGRPKPALAAYAMPIWVPGPRISRGGRLFVWGQLRPASGGRPESAEIQWRSPHGRFLTLATVRTAHRSGYLTVQVRPPASGEVRIFWPAGHRTRWASRSVAVTVG